MELNDNWPRGKKTCGTLLTTGVDKNDQKFVWANNVTEWFSKQTQNTNAASGEETTLRIKGSVSVPSPGLLLLDCNNKHNLCYLRPEMHCFLLLDFQKVWQILAMGCDWADWNIEWRLMIRNHIMGLAAAVGAEGWVKLMGRRGQLCVYARVCVRGCARARTACSRPAKCFARPGTNLKSSFRGCHTTSCDDHWSLHI